MVLDRGLASHPSPDFLCEGEMRFIMPLRWDFEILDSDHPLRDSFVYHGRGDKLGMKRWMERPSTSSRI
jgi:hypothetical protein